jgi:predicted nucleic acid-binding protein
VRELEALLRVLHLMPVTDELVTAAAELAAAEGLRGYDAVHLAAALEIGATVLSSADTALCVAAERCGLHVANPLIN